MLSLSTSTWWLVLSINVRSLADVGCSRRCDGGVRFWPASSAPNHLHPRWLGHPTRGSLSTPQAQAGAHLGKPCPVPLGTARLLTINERLDAGRDLGCKTRAVEDAIVAHVRLHVMHPH